MRHGTGSFGVLLVVALATAATTQAQTAAPIEPMSTPVRLPFFVGESLSYRVTVGRLGGVGHAAMRVDTPEVVRGKPAVVLRFDFHARVGLVGATDHTESWLDLERFAAVRFQKRERHPLSRHDERVELDAEAHRWRDDDGEVGSLASDAPLDELSFMYYVRTLPLDADTTLRIERHFDVARNPTFVRVLAHRTVTTAAGTFRTVLVEMRVQDPRRYQGEGVIRLDLTDDHYRIPVRIESQIPVVGRTTMLLERQNHPPEHHVALLP